MSEPQTRPYVSPRRRRQAEQTKAEILAAATELFVSRGWRGTTIAAVAARAGVVIDTIYSSFGSKAELLTAAKDAARDGDEADVPFFERAGFRAALSRDDGDRLQQIVELFATLNARTWQLDAVWREAAASEPSIREQATQRELDRRTHLGAGLNQVLRDAVDQHLVDTVWVLTGSEVYAKLVNTAGLTHQGYLSWLATSLARLLSQRPEPANSRKHET